MNVELEEYKVTDNGDDSTRCTRNATDLAYDLDQLLHSDQSSASYLARLRSDDEEVEVRRLSPSLSDSKKEEANVRLRLLPLLNHRVARQLRATHLDDDPPTFLIEYSGNQTLENWRDGSPLDVLRLLHGVVDCMHEAHHLGITHGALNPETIHVSHGEPRIDFSKFSDDIDSASDVVFGSVEAKFADRRAAANLLNWAFQLEGFEDACRSISHRDAARLRQLGVSSEEQSVEPPDLSIIAECLQSLVQGITSESNQVDSTSELLCPPPDSTSEIPCSPVIKADGTAELLPQQSTDLKPTFMEEPQVGDRLGRFRIESKLGEGGMGAVFKAIDLGTEQIVAIKVLNQSSLNRASSVKRFAKEARLLASLNNPYITNLVDVCNEGELHYIAIEFVNGVDAKRVLERHGPLREQVALPVIGDVARALVDAHQREIVHRDIKPENILLVGCSLEEPLTDSPPRAKLADFGIARHLDQSQSLAVTQAGSLLGTPLYMSPEQCKGKSDVMPQSDVYSLGITLFELLSGRPPFMADDAMALAGMHCFDKPPALRKIRPDVSEAVADLVDKCLAKRPEERYADATHFLKDLDRILRGEPSQVELRPVLPKHNAAEVISNSMTWQLRSDAKSLWPYVSNTERLNRAIGLPAVEYRSESHPTEGIRRFGTIRLAGISMTWEEHPFEWVEGRRMSVLREFADGPFQWFVSTVELQTLHDDATELTHTVKILPRHRLGKWIARIETGSKCRKSLTKVYEKIDQTLAKQAQTQVVTDDAFEPPPRLKTRQRDRIQIQRQSLLDEGADDEAVDMLCEFLLTAPAQEVASIRPIALAERLGLPEEQVIDTCLSAVIHGLLRLQWDILCPTCRVAADSKDTLKELTAHANCEACDYDFRTDLASAVELVFRADPSIRQTQLGKYCVGGPWHAPHVVAQLRLEAHERVETELSLGEGNYLLRGPRLPNTLELRVQTQGAPTQQVLILQKGNAPSRVYPLRGGNQILTIENGYDTHQLVRIERTIPRTDVLTAARAAATPRFRELFPGEILDAGRLVTAEQVTMLVVAIPTVEQFYSARGDAEAFELVDVHLSEVTSIVHKYSGEVVKIVGEAVFAVFGDTCRATKAAFAIGERNGKTEADLPPLAIGVHRGPALVTTANNRLDYFGATVRQVTALPDLMGQGISLTEPVFSDPPTTEWLAYENRVGKVLHRDLPGKPQQVIQHFHTKA